MSLKGIKGSGFLETESTSFTQKNHASDSKSIINFLKLNDED